MNIFITGINGFIGCNLARYLLNMGHNVSGSVRATSDLSFIQDLNINLHTGNIADNNFLRKCFKNQDIIFHIAALVSDWGPVNLFYSTNFIGTMNVANAALKFSVSRLIFMSSTAVYGFTGYRNRTEDSPRPRNNFPYALSKRQAEDRLLNFSRETGLPLTIIQPANVYGPYDRTFFIKFARALEKRRMILINKGLAWTCPTYIENLVDAIWIAATKKEAIGEKFIISDGLKITWRDFIDKICNELGTPLVRISVDFRLAYSIAKYMETFYNLLRIKRAPPITRYRVCNAAADYHFSIEKTKTFLGYSPKIVLNEAIKRTVQWYKNFKEIEAFEK